jgi:hypothetical protein
MTLQTTAGGLAELIIQMKSSLDPERVKLADQLETIMDLKKYGVDIKADFSGFTKYTNPSSTTRNNLDNLRDYVEELPDELKHLLLAPDGDSFSSKNEVRLFTQRDFDDFGEAVALQSLSVLYPAAEEHILLSFLRSLDDEQKEAIGNLITAGYHDKNPMRNVGDIRGPLFSLEVAVGYLRDFNRHRAMGRMVVALETDQVDDIIKQGFAIPEQLTSGIYWNKAQIHRAWEKDVQEFYTRLVELYQNATEHFGDKLNRYAFYRLLPLGHKMRMHFSGPVSQFSYFLPLRANLGGDYGYRSLAEEMKSLLRHSSPYLRNLADSALDVDPNDTKQLLGRS